jgi:hypothetical protein
MFRSIFSITLFVITFALLTAGAANAADMVSIVPDETVLPSETDPQIHTFDNPQAVYCPPGVPKGQLFVLLTGTTGKQPFAMRLSKNAAMLGFHVIQPMYPDDIPASMCRNDKDPDAFATFRWAIIAGGMSPHLPNAIPYSESIENRTIKLLAYLEHKHPNQHWGQFLQGGAIAWEKVALGGMSQGGGHAALIATTHRVARVLCFGAPKDYSVYWKAPANWYSKSITPPTRYFSFNNVHDQQGCDYPQQLEILKTLGITQAGGMADVDRDAPPFHHAHALFTSWPGTQEKIDSISAHTSVIRDNLFGSDGRPLFRSVWIHMLTASTD